MPSWVELKVRGTSFRPYVDGRSWQIAELTLGLPHHFAEVLADLGVRQAQKQMVNAVL